MSYGDRERAWQQQFRKTIKYAKALIKIQTGLPLALIPQDMAEAKHAKILTERVINEARRTADCRRAVDMFLSNSTIREIAAQIGRREDFVSQIIRREFGSRLQAQKARSHCRNGHEWSGNTSYDKRGYRFCTQCNRDAAMSGHRRKRQSIGAGTNNFADRSAEVLPAGEKPDKG